LNARIARSTAVRRGCIDAPRRHRSSAEETERLLLESARRAFGDKGYIRTTVQDIIDGTGLSRGAFYRYFRSTDDAFVRIVTEMIDEFVASSKIRSGDTLRERVRDGNRRYLEIFGRHRGVARALFEASYVNPRIAEMQARMRSAYLRRVRDHLERQLRKGACLPLDPDAAALSLGMMVESAAQSWAVMGLEPFETPLDVERLNDQMTAIWCRAVYRDPDAPQTAAAPAHQDHG